MESLEDRKSLRPLSPSDHRAYQIFAVGEPCKPNAEHVEINEGKREVRNGFVNLLHHKWWAPLARDAWRTFDLRDEAGQRTRFLVCSQVCHSRNSLPPDQ